MRQRFIVRGQPVSREKKAKARELRAEMTEAKRVLWQEIRREQLPGLRFRRQQIIHGYIVDFYCHLAGLVVEVDGSIHGTQAEYDAERDEILTASGFRILRFTNDQV